MTNKKQKSLKAFTLAEIIVVLGIASFIILAMMAIIRPSDKELKHQYYKAYHLLATATYNLYMDGLNRTDPTTKIATGTQFCEDLLFYMNTSTPSSDRCKGTRVSILGNSFTEAGIQYVASNGMIFYFSPDINDPELGLLRIVWIDINGPRGPNTAEWTKRRPADIVAFAVVDYGEVIPLGYPRIDERYMVARVYVPSTGDEDSTYGDGSLTGLYSFYNAQQLAYGGKVFQYDTFSYQGSTEFGSGALSIKKSDLDTSKKFDMIEQCKDPNNPDASEFSICTVEIQE